MAAAAHLRRFRHQRLLGLRRRRASRRVRPVRGRGLPLRPGSLCRLLPHPPSRAHFRGSSPAGRERAGAGARRAGPPRRSPRRHPLVARQRRHPSAARHGHRRAGGQLRGAGRPAPLAGGVVRGEPACHRRRAPGPRSAPGPLRAWVTEWLEAIEVAETERLLRRYATWEVLRPLRDKSARRLLSDAAHNGAKTRLKACLDLLEFVGRRGRAVDGCRQADLDAWAAGAPKSTVQAVQPFWRWAARHRLVPRGLSYPPKSDAPRGVPPADARQWDLARHLPHDDGVDCHHRVAGLFVVLYAQPVSRIARMTHDDVVATPSAVTVRLGRTPVILPSPSPATSARCS